MTEDRKRLLLNQIAGTLESMQRSGVGHIEQATVDGILYAIDEAVFILSVREVSGEESKAE